MTKEEIKEIEKRAIKKFVIRVCIIAFAIATLLNMLILNLPKK